MGDLHRRRINGTFQARSAGNTRLPCQLRSHVSLTLLFYSPYQFISLLIPFPPHKAEPKWADTRIHLSATQQETVWVNTDIKTGECSDIEWLCKPSEGAKGQRLFACRSVEMLRNMTPALSFHSDLDSGTEKKKKKLRFFCLFYVAWINDLIHCKYKWNTGRLVVDTTGHCLMT